MIETRNKKSILSLSLKSLKANKIRNIFAIIAIVLTTILFTSVATIGMSMIKSVEQSSMRKVGSYAHGNFKFLSQEEFDHIKDHKLIKELGYSIIVSFAENKELSKRPSEIRYGTDKAAEFAFSLPTTGRMPKEEREIATDTIVLDKLGIKHEIGQEIVLSYNINEKKFTDKFILSGYWKGDPVTPASMIWVSDKFIKNKLSGIDSKYIKQHMKETGNFSGLIMANVMFSNSLNVESKLSKILNDEGYSEKTVPTGVNWAYSVSTLTENFGTLFALIGLILIIGFSGYLIIFNIFYISIAKDTKFYGMLKTIGTTRKQIKSIVKKQALILSIIGIPIGLAAGYSIGSLLVPYAMQSLNVNYTVLSFNPLIFIGSALFSLITVLISCRKPAKVASKISPIEALRYTDVSTNKKNSKKSTNGAKLHKMALANIFRNRKKAFVVITSLSISIVLFNSVYTMVNGFSMETYLSSELCSDFSIADVSYYNPYMGYKGADTLTEDLVNELFFLDGVTDKGRVYFKESKHKLSDTSFKKVKELLETTSPKGSDSIKEKYKDEAKEILKTGEITLNISGIDEFVTDKFDLKKETFDYKKFATGDYVVIGKFNFPTDKNEKSYYNVGDSITIRYDDGTEKNYKVMAINELASNISLRRSLPDAVDIYLPASEFKAHVKNPTIMTGIFNVEDKNINSVENYLSNYTKIKNPSLSYVSRKTYEKEFAKVQSTYNTVGYSLSFIIALIGLFNFINSMVTNIISRKREHAMFQSIGMTGKQLYKMLIFEGLYYALFTMLIVLTIGTALNYLIVKTVVGSVWFFEYHFTIVPILICIPFLLAISIAIPIICYKTTSKMSIVERLRVE